MLIEISFSAKIILLKIYLFISIFSFTKILRLTSLKLKNSMIYI